MSSFSFFGLLKNFSCYCFDFVMLKKVCKEKKFMMTLATEYFAF